MSIALRQAAQPILASIGLDVFHVEIAHGTKVLQIVGECGKPLASINGIRFSKLDPNKKEIAYALILLETYLIKNKDLLLELYEAKKAQSLLPMPLKGDYSANITNINMYSENNSYQVTTSIELDGKYNTFYVTIPKSLDIDEVGFGSPSGYITKAQYQYILENMETLFDQAIKFARDLYAYNETLATVNALQSKLNSCGV